MWRVLILSLFFFNTPSTTQIYTLSLHDALPISCSWLLKAKVKIIPPAIMETITTINSGQKLFIVVIVSMIRSEEHTSELQSHHDLVCRLLLEKKKKKKISYHTYICRKSYRYKSS